MEVYVRPMFTDYFFKYLKCSTRTFKEIHLKMLTYNNCTGNLSEFFTFFDSAFSKDIIDIRAKS